MKKLLLFLMLLPCCALAQSQSITGSQCATLDTKQTLQVGFSVAGSWSGTIQPQVSTGGASPTNSNIFTAAGVSQGTVTANGNYFATPSGAGQFQLCGNTVTGTAVIVLNGVPNRNNSVTSANNAWTGSNIFSALATFDVSAMPAASFKLPSALSTGLVTVTNATGAISSVAAPAGTVVGTSDTQSFSNKTLNGAGGLNNVNLLCPMQTSAGAITGTGAAANVYTCAIPANTVGPARGFQIEVWFTCSTCTAVAKVFTWVFGATTVTYTSESGTATGLSHAVLTCFNTTAQTAQRCAAEDLTHSNTLVPGQMQTAAENLALASSVSFQFNAAATEAITPQMMVARLLQ